MENNTQLVKASNAGVLEVFSNPNYIKTAEYLSQSTLIPTNFKGKPADILIAFNMAHTTGFDPFMVMQNLDVINSKPSWSSKFLIALINSCGKFTSLKFKFGNDPKLGGMTCYAYATEKATGEQVVGPTISMKMAQDEGWLNKNGSKWRTMPEVMIRYRAASFFGRFNCPEVLFGLYSSEEQFEIEGGEQAHIPSPDGNDYLDLTDKTTQNPAPEPEKKAKPNKTKEPVIEQTPEPVIEVTEPAPEPEQAPETILASKSEKMQIFTLAKTLFGETANEKVKESLKKLGLDNTQSLTRDKVSFIMGDLSKMKNEEAEEKGEDDLADILDDISALDLSKPPVAPLQEAV